MLPYMGYIGMGCEGFSNTLLWDRVYKSKSLGLEWSIIFQETDQLVEDFSQTRETGNCFRCRSPHSLSRVSVSSIFEKKKKTTSV